ncbi:hypothetical protein ABTM47_19760, partial [Acinetobacter baumannii]
QLAQQSTPAGLSSDAGQAIARVMTEQAIKYTLTVIERHDQQIFNLDNQIRLNHDQLDVLKIDVQKRHEASTQQLQALGIHIEDLHAKF